MLTDKVQLFRLRKLFFFSVRTLLGMAAHVTLWQFSVPPRDGPSITGGIEDTKEGPFLDMMCVSGRSTPAAQLQWFINGKPVSV